MWRFCFLAFVAKPRFQVVDGRSGDGVVICFRVSCGDTVKFGPQLVRLFGIDAPEKGQTCDDGRWLPEPLAEKALEHFIAGRPVTCKQVDYDTRNNRPVAQCFAGDDDLQAMMVSAGWAWSFGRYSGRYAPEETLAVLSYLQCSLAVDPGEAHPNQEVSVLI